MRVTRWPGFVLIAGLVGISVSVAINLLLPVMLASGLLFGGLVVLLLVGGVAPAVIALRDLQRR